MHLGSASRGLKRHEKLGMVDDSTSDSRMREECTSFDGACIKIHSPTRKVQDGGAQHVTIKLRPLIFTQAPLVSNFRRHNLQSLTRFLSQ